MIKHILNLCMLCVCLTQLNAQSLSLEALNNVDAQLELISRDGSQLSNIIMKNDGDFLIRVNGIDEVIRIDDNTENVGIGTGAGPAAKLHIFSGVANEALRLSADTGTELKIYTNDTEQFEFKKLGNGNGDFQFRNANASSNTTFVNGGATRLIIEDDGNVSVGTGYSSNKLNVNVNGNQGIRVDGDNTGDAGIEINNNGTDTHMIYDDVSSGNDLDIQSPNNIAFNLGFFGEVARFRSGGPTQNLQLNTVGNFNAAQLYSNGTTVANTNVFAMIGQAGGVTFGNRWGVYGRAVTTTGNRYGVYGEAASGTGQWGVYCDGDFYHTGAFTSTSDERLKTNIRDSKYGLAELMQLKPKTYEFRKTGPESRVNLAKGEQFGFLAQELEKVMPEMVSTDNHVFIAEPGNPESEVSNMEIKGINYLNMISVLTKAVQEQQEIIEALESRIEMLENRLNQRD